jgi:hypothetical protein
MLAAHEVCRLKFAERGGLMAHAPIFDVAVDGWEEGKPAGKTLPRSVTATCAKCATRFQATAAQRTGEGTFATYLGAIHLHCPKCGAEGPVQLRRLKQ